MQGHGDRRMRLGPGELNKIIDDAIARKGRDPLEFYWLLVEELERAKQYKEKIKAERAERHEAN